MQSRRALIDATSYSIAIGVNDKLVWAGAIRWANLQRDIQATPDTIYRIGITSKAITATALAVLVDNQRSGFVAQ
ncbi:class A beta-lactamase-related serine hydrolase [Thalassotalea sp. HSM 43]|uniref:serine hydrolase n=1 Tax=Thalassotalea sp. HSM 43 TaxID=2552945 RepID=UPI001080C3C0|nr:serine hydrolase domain-containing protein [Thalassotalea sp. HSM 43]QBY02908.1 class A beta-lactamase-related serine hydrolase [Thalassotalea sp. HSM 43]